ncbi:hypothetical protein [Sphingomonas elodea]|uniref:hypothetical protein n=1 Tax=Sphingomonas elodea TaxID=179878 RepID=UPI0018727025|nr:hypothetical protein [Sphingomonas elodea]
MTPMGPVHVRMTGVVRGDEKGPGIGIVNAPTTAEATAELHRVARVSGADRVVSVAADYRRAALAGGTASTQWRIEVQAWGTAMAPAKPEAAEQTPDEAQNQEADKTRDAEAAKKAQDAQSKAREAAKPEDSPTNAKAPEPAPSPQASAPAVRTEAPPPPPATSAPSAPSLDTASAPPPAPVATSER